MLVAEAMVTMIAFKLLESITLTELTPLCLCFFDALVDGSVDKHNPAGQRPHETDDDGRMYMAPNRNVANGILSSFGIET